MSEQTDEVTTQPLDARPAPPPATTDRPEPEKDSTDWKVEARKWEQRAKDNRAAVEPLQKQMDALRKAFGSEDAAPGEDIVQSLQQRVQQMERDTLVNTVARRHGITDEDDVAFLRTAPDEDAMGRLAGRLKAAASTTTPNTPLPDPSQAAASPTPEALEEQEFAAFYPPTGK